jgi:hypothetical protein
MKNFSFIFFTVIVIFVCYGCNNTSGNKNGAMFTPPIVAPFTGIDTIATNDWWNRKPNKIIDVKVKRENVIAFGIYTVHNNVLKLSAQLFPLSPNETREVRLEIKKNDRWEEVQRKNVNDLGWSALFRLEDWDNTKDISYRILHGEKASFEGLIRKNPQDKNEIVLAALSCNSNQDR